MSTPTQIIDFWFEGITDETLIDNKAMPFKKWFMKDKKFDQALKNKFYEDFLAAKTGRYAHWENDQFGRLALILLYDQFSRNAFRDTPGMYQNDPLALALTLKILAAQEDKEYLLIHRAFLYMPLMHSEALAMQSQSVECFSQLVSDAQNQYPHNAGYFEYSLNYAHKHQHIIEQFKRFPHRNQILGRTSTQEEKTFLQTPGSAF